MADERRKRSESELNRTVASWKKILALSDEQEVKFRAVLVEGRNKRRDGYKPGGDWRQARKDARDAQNQEIQKTLTEEQFKRYLDVSELERNDR
jgi:hypothetical protein